MEVARTLNNVALPQVANIGPADWNHDETMSTLRYANRAKNIKNKPTKNEDPKDAMLRDMQQEMERLRAMLEGEQDTDGVCPRLRCGWKKPAVASA